MAEYSWGSCVLGTICEVQKKQLKLQFSRTLRGFVPVEEIPGMSQEVSHLNQIFRVGETVCACVIDSKRTDGY